MATDVDDAVAAAYSTSPAPAHNDVDAAVAAAYARPTASTVKQTAKPTPAPPATQHDDVDAAVAAAYAKPAATPPTRRQPPPRTVAPASPAPTPAAPPGQPWWQQALGHLVGPQAHPSAMPALGRSQPPVQPPIATDRNATAQDRARLAAAGTGLTTALGTAGDYITLGTAGGGVAGATVRDRVDDLREVIQAKTLRERLERSAQAAANQVPGVARAGPHAQAVAHTLADGHFGPAAVRAVNDQYATFGHKNAEAMGVGPTVRKAAELTNRVLPPMAGHVDPKTAESLVEGGAQFAATLVGPGNALPGLAAKGVGAGARLANAAARRAAPVAHKAVSEAVGDALGTAPITGTPYHSLFKDVHPSAHPQARAIARSYLQAPQDVKAPAMAGVKRAFDGLSPARGDEAAHRVVDVYQAGVHRRLVERADEADRANAQAITALHQGELAEGTANDRRIRVNLRDPKGHDNARFIELVPDAEARGRALAVADSMEHAARMPAGVTPDELRRAKMLEVDIGKLEQDLLAKGLLEHDETVPGYFPMRHAWGYEDQVPGTGGGMRDARRMAIDSSYRNPATFRTLAEARELGPSTGRFLSSPYAQTSVRQGYLLDRLRKLENLHRQDAYERLGALPTRSGGTMRQLPDYKDELNGGVIPGRQGPVPFTNRHGVTRMIPPNELAAKRLAQYQTQWGRGQALKDMGVAANEVPEFPTRRPRAISGGEVRATERAADSATALSARADQDADQAVIRANLRRARDDRAAAASTGRVADTVRQGAAAVDDAVGRAGMGVVGAAESGRAASSALADRVRRATMHRLSLTFRPQVPGASRAQAADVKRVLSEWVQHRLDTPPYQPVAGATVEDAAGNVLEQKVLGGAQHDTGEAFTGSDVERARNEVERVLGRSLPGTAAQRQEQVLGWLQDGYEKAQQVRARMPPEYRSAVAPAVQARVDAAAGAVERQGGATADRTIGAVQRGAAQTVGASERGANRTLRALDREAMRGTKLRETALAATVGDLGALVDRVANRASKFTDQAKRTALAQDLARAKSAVLDDYEARLAARKSDPTMTGRDLVVHETGYRALADTGTGLKDEPDAQVVAGLYQFLTAKRVPDHVAGPVSESMGFLNRFARTSLVFNPVIHTVNNQGTIYMALTGDARGVADATRAVFTRDGRAFEDFVRTKTFSDDPTDTMRYWDQLGQQHAAWHPTTYGSRGMGTEASITRDAQGAMTGYKRPTGHDDFAVVATAPVRELGTEQGRLSATMLRAKKIGYEMQRWNSEAVFNRGERVYAAYLMRHFVKHEGMDPAEAANAVRDAMGTDLLTEGERRLAGRVFFYPWMKTVIGLSLRLGIAKPQTWNAPLQGTATQRDAVGAGDVRFSKSNPYATAFPDGKGGFNSYSLPIFNRVLEPIARTVHPPEPDATWEDRAGPLGNYLLGHLNPLEQNALRWGVMGINAHALPPYMQPFDPDAPQQDQFLQGLRSAAGSVAYPFRAGEQAVQNPASLLPDLVGGTLGHSAGRSAADNAYAAHHRLILDLQRQLHAARRRGDEANAARLERDLEYQQSRE